MRLIMYVLCSPKHLQWQITLGYIVPLIFPFQCPSPNFKQTYFQSPCHTCLSLYLSLGTAAPLSSSPFPELYRESLETLQRTVVSCWGAGSVVLVCLVCASPGLIIQLKRSVVSGLWSACI